MYYLLSSSALYQTQYPAYVTCSVNNKSIDELTNKCWLVLVIKAPVEINTGRQQNVPLEDTEMRWWLKKYAPARY